MAIKKVLSPKISDKCGSINDDEKNGLFFNFHIQLNHIHQFEMKGKQIKKGETTKKKWQQHLPSSTHIRPSSMSFNPVGHAHDILGLCSFIWGAGKHK